MRVPVQACRQVPLRRSGLLGVALLAAGTVLLGVAACGAGQNAGATRPDYDPRSSVTHNGTVHGTVFGGGGPAVVSRSGKVGPAMENHPMEDAAVIVARAHSSLKFKTITSRDGAFSLSVPPGTYMLEAGSGKAICAKAWPPAVRVPPGGRVKRDIYCEAV